MAEWLIANSNLVTVGVHAPEGSNPFFLRKRNPRRKCRGFCVSKCVASKLAKVFGSAERESKACVGFMLAQDSLFGMLGQNPFYIHK